MFDFRHPGSGLGQQEAGADADGDQDHAHAERHREHDGAAEQRVAVGDGHAKRRDQQRRDAGADDQCRNQPHAEHAEECADLGVPGLEVDVGRVLVQCRLQERRQLQLVETEHGQRQEPEQRTEGDDRGGMLEIRLQLVAGGAGNDAGNGVGHGRAEYIGARQHPAL